MAIYCTAAPEERADIVDFINYVFSQAHCPHDFKTLLPKVYGDGEHRTEATHYLVKEEGRIKALIAQCFLPVSAAGIPLTYGLIGSVSVHPYTRGAGYMKQLMKNALEDAKAKGADLIVLGGQRQRYGYFGFENAGVQFAFAVTEANIRHCFKDIDGDAITFRPLDCATAEEMALFRSLYEKRPFHALRPSGEFALTLRSWGASPLMILKNGKAIGYSFLECGELVLRDEGDFACVMKALFREKGLSKTTVPVFPFEKERMRFLSDICEGTTLKQVEMIHVLNWKKVLSAFLTLKATYASLPDFTSAFLIDGVYLRISVKDGKPEVEESEKPLPGAIALEHNAAERLFFGLDTLVLPRAGLSGIAPLPFVIDAPDTF